MGQRGKISLCALFLFLGGLTNAIAQSNEQEPNRLSIGVMGAVTTGHLDLGSAFQSSVDANFEFQERLNNTLGFNIRYVATPEIALQTNVVFGKFSFLSDIFPNDALTFNNNYVATSLTTQLSLVRIFGASAKNFNLYGSFGTGLMFNDVSIDSESPEILNSDITPADHPFSNFFTTFGGGIRFNLGTRIDSYAQYEYSSASRDIIDGNFIGELLNLGGSSEISNSWSAVTFGLQFKFGASTVDADWPTVSRVVAPEPPPERDMFERLEELLARQADMFQEEIYNLTGRIDSLELALAEEKQRNNQLAEQLEEDQQETAQNEEMAEQIRDLQQQVAQLESALAAEQAEDEEQQPTIAEQRDEPADRAERAEYPRTKAIQRVRVQGEMIGVKELPEPLPVEIVLIPDAPEEGNELDLLAEIVKAAQPDMNDIVVEPEPRKISEITEAVQVEKDVSIDEETIEAKPITDTVFEQTPETDTPDEALAEANIEEEREEIFQKADSLRVVESIEELDSTSQGMAHVRDDVTRPDTADLEVPNPRPDEEEPELPETDQNQPEAEESTETGSEQIASADKIDSDDTAPQNTDQSIAQADTNTPDTDMDRGEIEENNTQAVDPADEPDDEDMNWTWYALIAVAVLGAVYFFANMFKPKSGSDSE